MLLRVDDFQSKPCRLVFKAMLELAETGKPIDFSFVYDKLCAGGITHGEAIDFICLVSDGQPVLGRTKDYAQRILNAEKRRKMTGLLAAAQSRAEGLDDPAEIIRDTAEKYQDIQAERSPNDIVRLDSATPEVLNDLVALRNGDESMLGIQTGIDGLDIATRGIGKGELWIVGALPSRGKSIFGTQVAMNAVTRGIPVFLISLEMSLREISKRILATECGASVIKTPQFVSQQKFSTVLEAAAGLAGLPLFADESSSLNSGELVLRARRAIRQHGIKLVIVDYLQLVSGRGKELRERVGEVGNSLRQLAKDTDVPVLAFSQLSRPERINDHPNMTKLRESGDLEAHAHTVLLLHTPISDDQSYSGEDEIIIGKQRNGSVGSIPVYLDRQALLFRSREAKQ
jgi:replicative DNA helicase